MKTKTLSIMLAIGLTLTLVALPIALANGPNSTNLLIRVYANELTEFKDVGTIVDISDWPGTADFIEQWRVNPNVQLRSYAEIGEQILDINNQRWPTGWNIPLTHDDRTDSDKHYYDYTDGMVNPDANQRRDWAAREFRKAIAYLCDLTRYTTEVCGGYAYALGTFVPIPALEGYTNYPSLEALGLIRHYSRTSAANTLYAAGFRDWNTDGILEWQDPGPDMLFGTTDDVGAPEALPELVFYIRMDDSQRMRAGILLADELAWAKINVKRIITERSVCWRQVMVLYDFHLYTGGWSLTAVPEWLYTIWGAEYYWAPVGWSGNYDGFCDLEYDSYAYNVYTATNETDLLDNAVLAQERFAELQPGVPWWSAAAVKAYKNGWSGFVNDVGYGVDNYYSFFMGSKTGDTVIDYGFKSDLQNFHVISSQWLWDWNALGLIYETLIGRGPFNKAIGVYDYWLATSYTKGTWEGDKTMINFTIRSGVTWQDGTAFTPADVAFSFEFTHHCGSGIAWNFASVQNLNSTGVDGNVVWVKMNVAKPLTGQEDFGMLPIIPKHIWEAEFQDWQTWFNHTTGEWAPLTTREVVRNWQYFEEAWTGPSGIPMTKAFGTGAWIFKSHVAGESITYDCYTGHYKTAADVATIVANDFWKYMGDVNFNFRVDGIDLTRMSAAFGVLPIVDKDCDFNKDNAVNAVDHFLVVKNFGRYA